MATNGAFGRWTVLAVFLLEITSVFSEKSSFDDGLYRLVNEILVEYFHAYKCLTFAADSVGNVGYLETGVPMFVINLEELPTGKLMLETFEQGCGGYIIQTHPEGRLSMIRMLLDAKNETVSHRYNTQKYLFLPVTENDTDRTVLFQPGLFFLPDLVLVIPETSGTFSIDTHSVFDSENRERFEVVDRWSPGRGYRHRNNLYSDKIKNVHGKNITFGVMHYVPYSVVVHEGGKTIVDGLEARIGMELVKLINGTCVGLDHPKELWGTKFPNGSGNGIFGSVLRGDADFGYSAVYQWYCDVLDCTYPYLQAEVTCLVPRPQTLVSWQTIFLPFTVSTWIALCVAYLVSTVFVFGLNLATNQHRDVKWPEKIFSVALESAFILFRLQMQQTPKSSHKSDLLSNFIKISYLYSFLVVMFWQGGIASILTVPRYEKPIDSPADLLARYPGVRWGANHDVWIHSIENSTEPVLREIVKKFVVLPSQVLVDEAKKREFGFFMEKLHGNGHFGFNEYINEETIPYLRLMKENVHIAFPVIILPKGSPYLEKLDHIIHWMFDTGIVLKLETQVSLEVIDNHLQNMIRFSDERQSGKAILTVGHITGPIVIYLSGIFISTVALMGEKYLFSHFAKMNQIPKSLPRPPPNKSAIHSRTTRKQPNVNHLIIPKTNKLLMPA